MKEASSSGLEGCSGPLRDRGSSFSFPLIDKMVKVSLRTVVLDIPPQDVITRDNVTIKVNAVVFFRVIDSLKAIIDVENYLYAASQLAQTTLRSVLGQAELDDLLSKTGEDQREAPGDTGHPYRSRGA